MGQALPRVLHVSLVPGIHQGAGIVQQLMLEREAAHSLNIPWDTALFAPHVPHVEELDLPNHAPLHLFAANVNSLANRVRTNLHLKRSFYAWLEDVEESYDVLLLRYSVHDRRLRNFLTARQGMVGLVHHSCEVPELMGLNGPIGKMRGVAEKVLGPGTISQADVIVAVTSEIAEYQLRRASPTKVPTLVYPNGGPNAPVPVADRRGVVPEFLFVASHFSPWQGLDLLLNSLRNYDGDVILHLVGTMNTSDAELAGKDPRVVVHGVADSAAIRNLAEHCWAGISSLATERQGLRVACPLKVREYLSMGLPAIGSHFEELPAEFPFYAQVRPDIASIIACAGRWKTVSRTQLATQSTILVSKARILENTYRDLVDLWTDWRRSSLDR